MQNRVEFPYRNWSVSSKNDLISPQLLFHLSDNLSNHLLETGDSSHVLEIAALLTMNRDFPEIRHKWRFLIKKAPIITILSEKIIVFPLFQWIILISFRFDPFF